MKSRDRTISHWMPVVLLVGAVAVSPVLEVLSPAAASESGGDVFDTTGDELGRYRASLGSRTMADAASLDRALTSHVLKLVWVA